MARRLVVLAALVALVTPAFAREMTSAYVITAVANKRGLAGTDWHSDLTLYNPQSHRLALDIFFLPTGQDNSGGAPELPTITLEPWQTLNLCDVLESGEHAPFTFRSNRLGKPVHSSASNANGFYRVGARKSGQSRQGNDGGDLRGRIAP